MKSNFTEHIFKAQQIVLHNYSELL